MAAPTLTLTGLPGLPLVSPGDDLTKLIQDGLDRAGISLADGDVVVVAQKVVSKAEGRYAVLADVVPSDRAIELAQATEKDPRLVELILQESEEVVRTRPGVLIVAHRLGFVMANAGIDRSNIDGNGERVLLLPENPDASAARLRDALARASGARIAVIVSDSIGRAWRNGTVGHALGAAGLPTLLDARGRTDLFGRALAVTEIGFADEIAAAASLIQGQADESAPVVLVRGLAWQGEDTDAAALIRAREHDLFR